MKKENMQKVDGWIRDTEGKVVMMGGTTVDRKAIKVQFLGWPPRDNYQGRSLQGT
jgi:hypothetical protein